VNFTGGEGEDGHCLEQSCCSSQTIIHIKWPPHMATTCSVSNYLWTPESHQVTRVRLSLFQWLGHTKG